jgi:hypothetical protein
MQLTRARLGALELELETRRRSAGAAARRCIRRLVRADPRRAGPRELSLGAVSSRRLWRERAARERGWHRRPVGAGSRIARALRYHAVRMDGHPRFAERQRLLLRWFPRAKSHLLAEATHLMLLEDPSAVARCLAEFFDHCRALGPVG